MHINLDILLQRHNGPGYPGNQGASLTDCDGEGMMSYDPAPNKWSSCSKKDLTAHYKEIGSDDWCLTPGNIKLKIYNWVFFIGIPIGIIQEFCHSNTFSTASIFFLKNLLQF